MLEELDDWLVLRACQLSRNSWEVLLYNAHVEHKLGAGPTFEAAYADAMASESYSAEYVPPPDAPTLDLRALMGLDKPSNFVRRF